MARTVVHTDAIKIAPGPYGTPVTLDFTHTADSTNGNYFLASGDDLLLVENSSSDTVTITLPASPQGRTATVTATFAGLRAFHLKGLLGFAQPDDTNRFRVFINSTGGNTAFAVVRL